MLRQMNWKIVGAMFLCAAVVQAVDNGGSIQGVVKSASGEPVSGAFVKVKNPDRRLTFMVISQVQGQYTASSLPPGKYEVQGVGGDFQSEMSAPIEVTVGRPAAADLRLTVQRAPDLPHAWPGMLPGQIAGEGGGNATVAVNLPEGAGKAIVQTKCVVCHGAGIIVSARFDRKRWEDTIEEMRSYAQGSTIPMKDLTDQESKTLLDYVTANFSNEGRGRAARPTPDPNSRLPRTLMQGAEAKYIAVEFTLPNPKSEPHEVTVDMQGNAWASQRAAGHLGKLDPKTLNYAELDPPAGKSSMHLNGITRAPDGKLWFVDASANRRFISLDPKTMEYSSYPLPKLKTGRASGNTMRVAPDGSVWLASVGANEMIRLQPNSKEFTVYSVPAGVKAQKNAAPYGIAIDGDQKVWFVENAMNGLGRITPSTGQIDEFKVPVDNSVPRKAGMDSQGNVWFGLHFAGKLMKVDYKTLKMTVYNPPTENAGVYSIQGDTKSRYIWMSEQHADKIARFDPQTEQFLEFPLATAEEDNRRIEIDPTNSNRIWWSGNVSGRVGYIELLN
jgi:virginiamycin B lyase